MTTEKTTTQPQESDITGDAAPLTQADIDAAVAMAVGGLKAKNSELLGKLKGQADQLKQFEGIDPEAVRSIVKQFADDEEAKLIAAGKVDEVLNKRTERMKEAHGKELARLQAQLEAANERAGKFTNSVLGDAIRAAGSDAGIHKTAFEDAIARARAAFEINDDGEAVAKDGVFGKDGKPLTLKEWFDDMKDKAAHWFPAPQGGGLGGGKAAGQKNPFAKETWNMTEQGQLYKTNPDLARNLAAQAGVPI